MLRDLCGGKDLFASLLCSQPSIHLHFPCLPTASRSHLSSNYNTRSLPDSNSFNRRRTSTNFFFFFLLLLIIFLGVLLSFFFLSGSWVDWGLVEVNQSSNAKVTGCLSSLLARALARSHLSQPGHWGEKKLTNYTSWDEESWTLKQSLASKIEIWKHLVFKCNINSPQISLTNYIYEPNTIPRVHNISQYYYDPNYFQKQLCHYQLLAKAMPDALEYLLHSLYNFGVPLKWQSSSTDSISIHNSCLCKTLNPPLCCWIHQASSTLACLHRTYASEMYAENSCKGLSKNVIMQRWHSYNICTTQLYNSFLMNLNIVLKHFNAKWRLHMTPTMIS